MTARTNAAEFIRAQTRLAPPSLVPELQLWLATDVTPLWQATEASLAEINLPPPYWAFAWPGGQALARYLLDHPEICRGRRVLDLAAGCGIGGLAAAKTAAAHVTAADIDDLAAAAMRMNAEANGLEMEITTDDLTLGRRNDWDVILAGDVCYERPMAETMIAWLTLRATQGADVLLADPGRAYLPQSGLSELDRYEVPTSLDLEDRIVRTTRVMRLAAVPIGC